DQPETRTLPDSWAVVALAPGLVLALGCAAGPPQAVATIAASATSANRVLFRISTTPSIARIARACRERTREVAAPRGSPCVTARNRPGQPAQRSPDIRPRRSLKPPRTRSDRTRSPTRVNEPLHRLRSPESPRPLRAGRVLSRVCPAHRARPEADVPRSDPRRRARSDRASRAARRSRAPTRGSCARTRKPPPPSTPADCTRRDTEPEST